MANGPFYPSNWEELRQQQFDLDNHTCKGCGITRQQLSDFGLGHLECHHINTGPPNYFHPGGREVVGVNLITFCNRCHEAITNSVHQQTNLLAPRKKVRLSVSDEQGPSTRESIDRPGIQITVEDETPTQLRESASKRIEIKFFSE